MVAVKSPLSGMQMDPQAAAYIGILERRITAMQINELKFQALLEISTGEKWNTMVFDFEQGNLTDIAVQMIMKKTGADEATARAQVRDYYKELQNKWLSIGEKAAIDNNKNAVDNLLTAPPAFSPEQAKAEPVQDETQPNSA